MTTLATLPPTTRATIIHLSEKLAAAEAVATQRGLPAGSAHGGADLETLVSSSWTCLAHALVQDGLVLSTARAGLQEMSCLTNTTTRRAMYLPGAPGKYRLDSPSGVVDEIPEIWGNQDFLVSSLVDHHLGRRVLEFAPVTPEDSELYHGSRYPQMYKGKKTGFDFTLALVESGVLKEKMLFEYKSAKSSRGVTMDGNAHERLSFQLLQYLEVAGLLNQTTFNVLLSSAYSKYRNKYHVAFNQQSIRLGDVFKYFVMRVITNKTEYRKFFGMIVGWLFGQAALTRNYRKLPL